jgi:hypothetical protein
MWEVTFSDKYLQGCTVLPHLAQMLQISATAYSNRSSLRCVVCFATLK